MTITFQRENTRSVLRRLPFPAFAHLGRSSVGRACGGFGTLVGANKVVSKAGVSGVLWFSLRAAEGRKQGSQHEYLYCKLPNKLPARPNPGPWPSTQGDSLLGLGPPWAHAV